MKTTTITVALALMLVCQTGPNLDVIPLGGKDCGLEGDAKGADVKALNRLKGRYNSPVTSDFDQTVTLTAMISPGDDENRFDTKSAATVIGYVLEVQVGGKETCNCHATADDDRDTHVALDPLGRRRQDAVGGRGGDPATRMLRKMAGKNDWTTSALRRDIQGKWVEVTGWLLFDFEHIHEAENTNPGGTKDWRATCWEIHPVTSIRVLDGPPEPGFRVAASSVRAFQRAPTPRTSTSTPSGGNS